MDPGGVVCDGLCVVVVSTADPRGVVCDGLCVVVGLSSGPWRSCV